MALAYLLSHVLGLQARSPAPLPEPDTRTLVSYAFVTPSITINGPYILVTMTPGNPLAAAVTTTAKAAATPTTTTRRAIATTTSSTESDDSTTDSSAQSTTDSSDAASTTLADITTSVAPNTVVALPTTPASLTPGLNQVSATQAATSATATATEPQKGMSGGAVAGLIFGLLLGIGAIVGIVILLYRRKKQGQGSHARLDDEKAFTSRPDALPQHPLPSMAQPQHSVVQTPPTAAPTNFASGAPITPLAAGGIAAAGVVASSRGAPSPMSTTSAWERPGSSRFNDPENPFGNHAELSTTPPKLSLSINTAAAAAAGAGAGAISTAPAPVELHTEPLTAPGPINAADFPLPQSMPASPASAVAKKAVPTALVAGGAAAVAGAAVAGVTAAAAKEEAKVHRVQMDFVPSMDDELAIRTGQLVKVQHEYDDGWALVGYMDGSKSGVVPRTCLSKNALKPRPQNGPGSPNGRPGPAMRPGNGPPRAMTPQGRNSPAPFAQTPRPLTPTGRGAQTPSGPPPAPFAQASRPGSGASTGRIPAQSNAAAPYVAYAPQGPASAATDATAPPSRAGQSKPTPRPDDMKRRSNSIGAIDVKKAGETEPPILMSPLGQMPTRKPVGGGMSSSPPAAAPLS